MMFELNFGTKYQQLGFPTNVGNNKANQSTNINESNVRVSVAEQISMILLGTKRHNIDEMDGMDALEIGVCFT